MSTTRSLYRYRQRTSLRLATAAAAAVLCACGPDIAVRTAASPEANALAGRHTFRVVETSATTQHDGDGNGDGNGNSHVQNYGVYDPMVSNSITKDAVRDEIIAAFEARGYRYAPDHADFEITFTATVAPILDVYSYDFGGYGAYGYGYGYYGNYYSNWGYGAHCCGDGFGYASASYERSTVVIDAVDPTTKKLLWRGQGTSGPYSQSKKFMKTLRHAVNKVAHKFPPAGTMPMVASTPLP
jgi:hypothetical protein